MAEPAATATGHAPSRAAKWTLFVFLGAWLAFQVLMPLRHLLYSGSPSWNEEGAGFAWRMMVRNKQGFSVFSVRDPASGKQWLVLPRQLLRPGQARKVARYPDIARQFAHHLADVWAKEKNIEGVEVRAVVCVSLNGREPELLIDPNRDLARIEHSVRQADWVLPLRQPFERPPERTGRVNDDFRC